MTPPLPLHVEVKGGDTGKRDVFVLLHGYGGSSFSWRTWVPELTRRGRAVLVDLKGFGAAPRPDDNRYAPGDHAELVHRLLVEMELHGVTLVGHSLGGGIALLTALRLLDEGQDRLARMVLLAPSAYRQKLPPFVSLARRPRLSRALMRGLGSRFVVAQVLRSIVFDASQITHDQVEGYAGPLRGEAAYKALIRTALQVVPPDLDALVARYRSVDVPALLLWGRQDRVVSLRVGERLAATLPRAKLAVLERCGHLPAEERPVESLAALTAFLDRGDPEAPA